MAKILIVDDDAGVLDVVEQILKRDQHTVDSAYKMQDALLLLETNVYELLILDWQLPDGSGIEILKTFRAKGGKTPALMLTGKSESIDKASGLDSGADDYLTKPFEVLEFSARVRALLRRSAIFHSQSISLRGICVDTEKHTVCKDGQPVELYRREFQILEFLMKHPDRVFSPDDILNSVWPANAEVGTEACRSAIKRLRQNIDPEHEIIQTVRGVGFVFKTKQ